MQLATGITTLNNNVTIADSKALAVGTGATSLGGPLTVTGATTLKDNVSIDDSKALAVGTGATSLGGCFNCYWCYYIKRQCKY